MRKILELSHEIDIDAPANDLWLFFENLEENYKLWHPQDHIIFKWLGSKPIKAGTKFHSQQIMMGRVVTYDGMIESCEPNHLIRLTFEPPISWFMQGITWEILTQKQYCSFRATTYLYDIWWYQRIFPKQWQRMIRDHNIHVEQEASYMKQIMEG